MTESAPRVRIALALLLALFAGRLLHTAASQSFTIDEPGYVGTGLQLWRTGDYDFARVLQFHPPLAFHLASVPLLFMDLGDAASQPRVGPALLREGGPPLQRLRLASRLPFVLATVWGALLCFLWAREAASPGAGLLAAFLYSFSPSFLAYGPLAHSDALIAVLTLQALYTLWRWERRPSAGRLVACGVSLGLALVAKLSAVLLLPAFGLELLRAAWRGGSAFPAAAPTARLARAAGVLAALGALSLAVIWLAYGGSFALSSDPTGRFPQLPLPGWLRALLWVGDANDQPRAYFFLGSLRRGGDALFMPVAFLSKEAIGWLALVAGALVLLATRRASRLAGFLAIPCAIYVFILVVWLDVPLGYRYALPLVGLLCVLAGAELWPPAPGWRRHAVWAACALLALESLSVHPHYLAFFNRAVGGPANGHTLLLDSNLDWGQDVTTLARALERHGNPPVWLALFAAEDPARLGVRGAPLIGCAPVSGWLAISANVRFGLYAAHNYMAPPTPGCYAWLDAYPPVAVPGGSIYLFELPPSAGAAPSPALFSPR
jgi:4-amino-4-deoxy-L-arabinose transferase-like glycosyltransferase